MHDPLSTVSHRPRATFSWPLATTLCLLLAAALPAGARGAPNDAASIKQGAALYRMDCASCHGARGMADGPVARTLTTRPADFSKGQFRRGGTDDDLFKSIERGVPGTQMTGWKGRLTDDEILTVIAFIRSLKR